MSTSMSLWSMSSWNEMCAVSAERTSVPTREHSRPRSCGSVWLECFSTSATSEKPAATGFGIYLKQLLFMVKNFRIITLYSKIANCSPGEDPWTPLQKLWHRTAWLILQISLVKSNNFRRIKKWKMRIWVAAKNSFLQLYLGWRDSPINKQSNPVLKSQNCCVNFSELSDCAEMFKNKLNILTIKQVDKHLSSVVLGCLIWIFGLHQFIIHQFYLPMISI